MNLTGLDWAALQTKHWKSEMRMQMLKPHEQQLSLSYTILSGQLKVCCSNGPLKSKVLMSKKSEDAIIFASVKCKQGQGKAMPLPQLQNPTECSHLELSR